MRFKTSFVLLFHSLFTIVLFLILLFFGFVDDFPSLKGLLNWDAGWLNTIRKDGYSFNPNGQSNIAFFPLFPLVWRFLSVGPIQICLFNLICFYSGCMVLKKTYAIKNDVLLLLLSTPSIFFCFLPYSEALFFLSGSMLLYGLKKNHWLMYLGIFLACLTRSASMIFIPIIITMGLFNLKKENIRQFFVRTIIFILILIGTTLLANYIQYLESGKFFAIFETQVFWNRTLSIPSLYFTSWDAGRLVWLDGLALFMGFCSLWLCFVLLVKKLKKKNFTLSPDILFSLGYTALVVITNLLYTGLDAKGGSTLLSLNRYVFATPFFFVLVLFLFKLNLFTLKNSLLFLVISSGIWSLFGLWETVPNIITRASNKTETKIYFAIIFAYSYLYIMLSKVIMRKHLVSGIYVFNMLLQIFLLDKFLSGAWIG